MKNTLTFRHTFKSGASCSLRVDLDAARCAAKGAPFTVGGVACGDAEEMRKAAAGLAALEALLRQEWASNRPPLRSSAPEVRVWLRAVVEHFENLS